MGHLLVDAAGRVRRQSLEDILEVRIGNADPSGDASCRTNQQLLSLEGGQGDLHVLVPAKAATVLTARLGAACSALPPGLRKSLSTGDGDNLSQGCCSQASMAQQAGTALIVLNANGKFALTSKQSLISVSIADS